MSGSVLLIRGKRESPGEEECLWPRLKHSNRDTVFVYVRVCLVIHTGTIHGIYTGGLLHYTCTTKPAYRV